MGYDKKQATTQHKHSMNNLQCTCCVCVVCPILKKLTYPTSKLMPVPQKIPYDVNFIRSNLIFGFIFSKNRSHISKNKRRLKQDSPRFIKNCYHYIPFKSSSIFSNLESEGFGNFKSTIRPFLSNNINRGIAPTRKAIIDDSSPAIHHWWPLIFPHYNSFSQRCFSVSQERLTNSIFLSLYFSANPFKVGYSCLQG